METLKHEYIQDGDSWTERIQKMKMCLEETNAEKPYIMKVTKHQFMEIQAESLALQGITAASNLKKECAVIEVDGVVIRIDHNHETRHRCHNRKPFPDSSTVQDGYFITTLNGHTTQLPNMIRIPFKMSRVCHQHEEMGAVTKGLMSAEGCEGCIWKPK